MTARSITDSILKCKIAASLRFFLDRCMHAQRRQGVVYTLNLFQLFNQSLASKYPPPRTYLWRNQTLLAGALLPRLVQMDIQVLYR